MQVGNVVSIEDLYRARKQKGAWVARLDAAYENCEGYPEYLSIVEDLLDSLLALPATDIDQKLLAIADDCCIAIAQSMRAFRNNRGQKAVLDL